MKNNKQQRMNRNFHMLINHESRCLIRRIITLFCPHPSSNESAVLVLVSDNGLNSIHSSQFT